MSRMFPHKVGQMEKNLQLWLGLINLRIKRSHETTLVLGWKWAAQSVRASVPAWRRDPPRPAAEVTGWGTAAELHTSFGPEKRGEDRYRAGFGYGLNNVLPDSYAEVLTPRTSEGLFWETGPLKGQLSWNEVLRVGSTSPWLVSS